MVDLQPLERDGKKLFQERLLSWFWREGRDFPWRLTTDPFAVLVAEKLLQQTRVRDTVVDAYGIILERYATPAELAQADLPDLEEIIRPLGLVYRAAELQAMARELMERHDGRIPDNLKELMHLTGVGSYVARAVMSFAYGKDVPIVDTNVARILYRVFAIPGPMPANPARKRILIELADSLIPEDHARQFNLAMLDLGALICTPTSPNCDSCPINEVCRHGRHRLAQKERSTDPRL
jgi:A/G-specific adenine glycosylase